MHDRQKLVLLTTIPCVRCVIMLHYCLKTRSLSNSSG
jgi:hypothetical protein